MSAFVTAHAAEYRTTQISNEDVSSRDPVISDTGMAAWAAYLTTASGEVGADIMVFTNGVAQPLFRTRPRDVRASLKPELQANNLVWVSVGSGARGAPSWILREVPSPDRDTPVPELTATFALTIRDDGTQVWQEPSTAKVETAAADATATGEVAAADAPAATPPPPADTNVVSLATDTNAPAAPASTNVPPPPPPRSEPPIEEPEPDLDAPDEPARRHTSGDAEVMLWRRGSGEIRQLTRDNRDDLGPSVWGDIIAWQTAKGWPFGWEIMCWAGGQTIQLTTNYYYDMAPRVHGSQIAWYGWDGHDFEVFLYDHSKGSTIQITSNQYDDVSPAIWDGVIVWEGYAGADADIFMWKDGQVRKISKNVEDDLNPRIWKDKVVWQGFDGDDFEIYLYDIGTGAEPDKLTSNTYDDVNPDARDGVICWMGYHDNWDAEIFAWDGGPNAVRITENEHEDRNPRTAGGRIIWESEQSGKSLIFLAEPK